MKTENYIIPLAGSASLSMLSQGGFAQVSDGMEEDDTKVPIGDVADDVPADLGVLVPPVEEVEVKVKRGRGSRRQAGNQPAPDRPSHLYAPEDANEVLIHPDLRDSTGTAPTANMMSVAEVLPPQPIMHAHAVMMHNPDPEDEDFSERKPKRELSQSKRAAQNRAAQRAFRQRKEGYIKKLEVQVRDYNQLESSYKTLQMENYALREYVHVLQNRLMEAHAECPPPPPNLDLNQQHHTQVHLQSTNGVDIPMTDPVTLDAVAQAVVGLAAHQVHMGNRQQQYSSHAIDQSLPTDDIHKLLQVDSQ